MNNADSVIESSKLIRFSTVNNCLKKEKTMIIEGKINGKLGNNGPKK